MAEEKPHEASPTKLRKARSEGNVARSGELNGAFSFLTASFSVLAIVPFMVPLFVDWFRAAASGVPLQLMFFVRLGIMVALPMLASGVTGGFIGIVQTQGPTFKPLKLDFKKLMPNQGLKKMFSRESIVNAARAFFSAAIAVASIRSIFAEVFSRGIISTDPMGLAIIAKDAIIHIVGVLFGVGLVFGFFDFIITHSRWKKGLKMTHDELKRDSKENYGDPQIKGKRKQFHRSMLRGSPAKVADATMVVTNPTHFAIALEYRPPTVPIPRLLCRAADEMAFEVRRMAELHNVPIIENVALARTLFARGKPGKEIPEDTYLAVAEIVAALQRDAAEEQISQYAKAA